MCGRQPPVACCLSLSVGHFPMVFITSCWAQHSTGSTHHTKQHAELTCAVRRARHLRGGRWRLQVSYALEHASTVQAGIRA